MKIAITGANGFIGSNLTLLLATKGHEVRAIVRERAHIDLLSHHNDISPANYNQIRSIQEALSGCDAVIHNAGITRTRSHTEMLDINVGLTKRVIEAANGVPSIKKFVLMSSQAASRPSQAGEDITESDEEAPVTWYGKSKLLAEYLVKRDCKVPWTIIRPVSVYGGGDRDFLAMFKAATKGVAIKIGHRERLLNLICISELADFAEMVLDKQESDNNIFFASDGATYTQSAISSTIAGISDRQPIHIRVPEILVKAAFFCGELIPSTTGKASLLNRQKMLEIMAPNWTCSIAKARELLGWNPQPRLRENLMDTLQWYREHNWL